MYLYLWPVVPHGGIRLRAPQLDGREIALDPVIQAEQVASMKPGAVRPPLGVGHVVAARAPAAHAEARPQAAATATGRAVGLGERERALG